MADVNVPWHTIAHKAAIFICLIFIVKIVMTEAFIHRILSVRGLYFSPPQSLVREEAG